MSYPLSCGLDLNSPDLRLPSSAFSKAWTLAIVSSLVLLSFRGSLGRNDIDRGMCCDSSFGEMAIVPSAEFWGSAASLKGCSLFYVEAR